MSVQLFAGRDSFRNALIPDGIEGKSACDADYDREPLVVSNWLLGAPSGLVGCRRVDGGNCAFRHSYFLPPQTVRVVAFSVWPRGRLDVSAASRTGVSSALWS